MLQIFRKFMCIYTILENFVNKRNKSGLNSAMKTGWVFDIASGVVSILNQNGRWHKKLSRGILEALLALDAEM